MQELGTDWLDVQCSAVQQLRLFCLAMHFFATHSVGLVAWWGRHPLFLNLSNYSVSPDLRFYRGAIMFFILFYLFFKNLFKHSNFYLYEAEDEIVRTNFIYGVTN